jgi:YggT family protein
MTGVSIITGVISFALTIFLILLWVRFIFELVTSLSRSWRPRGFALVIAEVTFTVTDPPIRAVRRVIPPLRVGGIAIDFAFTIVMIAVLILIFIVGNLA